MAVNKWTDYQVVADHLELGVTPLDLRAQGLRVSTDNQMLVDLQVARLSFDWRGYFADRHTLWRGDFTNGKIDLSAFPRNNTSSTKESPLGSSVATQLHAILTALNGQVENIEIVLNDQSALLISNLATQLDGNEQQGYQALKQNINLSLKFDDHRKTLNLDGLFSSSRQDGVTNLVLELQEVDLSEFLLSVDAVDEKTATQSTEFEQSLPEAPIDWAWLEKLEGMNVSLSAPKLTLKDNTLEEVFIMVGFEDSIDLEKAQAKVDWGLSEELRIQDSLTLSGLIKPLATETSGVDIDADIKLFSPLFELIGKGQINLNSASGQQLSIGLSMQDFPVMEQNGDLFSGLLQQYLPINLTNNITSATNKVQLNIAKSSLGQTVFDSIIRIENLDREKPKIEVALNADTVSYQSPIDSNEDDSQSETADTDQTTTKLFSDDEIDFSFLQLADVSANLDVKEFVLNKVTIDDMLVVGALGSTNEDTETSERVLNVGEFSAKIAEGEISGGFELRKSAQPAQFDLRFDVTGLALESLSFMPQEQLSGGNLTIDTDLRLVGDSLAALASSSNGQFYLDVADAVVQNDRFELIGSDLILELLSKLNPFSKSDPTTQLECAAVYVPLENGVAELDNSIALQTSKLVIVADGDIDLNSEKLNLKITPTSKAGIGVNVSSMVKFIKLGGRLANPTPEIDAGGVVASGLAAGAAISTGGASLLATGLLDKVTKNDVCEKVSDLYQTE
ncbi:MAG: AsmA-like C-terminal region-containing protein [Acidiferrobacterales bacterium]|nr:AsmA-like C-terminal region-containing protein [Acidiferrobacterales bacterium]